jgi:glutathione S-transferase
MIAQHPVVLWTATVTVLITFFYFFTAFRVGQFRQKHGIRAPATSGHPEFDRAYRIQLNTFEQMGIVLPFLWVAAFYPIGWAWLAPLVGLIWIASRIIYFVGYMADPEKRLAGAVLGGICNFALFLIAAIGVARIWFLPSAM